MRKTEKFAFDEKKLRLEISRSAVALGVSKTAAEKMAREIADKVAKRMEKRSVATMDDLNRFVAVEAEKFSKDLAYVYKNRGKII